ncbi:uncharacterized protein [Centruroides vittatus]
MSPPSGLHLINRTADIVSAYSSPAGGSSGESACGTRYMVRRHYVTYPPTFKLAVVNYAEKNGISAASAKYEIDQPKVTLWCKVKDNIIRRIIKKGLDKNLASGETEDSNSQDHQVSSSSDIAVTDNIDDLKNITLTNSREKFCCKMKELTSQEISFQEDKTSSWEIDVFVIIRKQLIEGNEVKVKDLVEKMKEMHPSITYKDGSELPQVLIIEWCRKFGVHFITEDYCKTCGIPENLKEDTQLAFDKPAVTKPSSGRRRLYPPVAFKLQVVKFALSHSKSAAARKFSVDRKQVSHWVADKDRLEKLLDMSDTTNKPVLEDVNDEIWEWYREMEDKGEETTKEMICAQAEYFFKRRGCTSFTASDDWYRQWCVARNFRNSQKEEDHCVEETKLGVLNSKSTSSNKLEVDRKQIFEWVTKENFLLNEKDNNPVLEEVNDEVWEWLRIQQKKGKQVTKRMLCTQAEVFCSKLGYNFFANDEWYKHWCEVRKSKGCQVEDIIENIEPCVDDDGNKETYNTSVTDKQSENKQYSVLTFENSALSDNIATSDATEDNYSDYTAVKRIRLNNEDEQNAFPQSNEPVCEEEEKCKAYPVGIFSNTATQKLTVQDLLKYNHELSIKDNTDTENDDDDPIAVEDLDYLFTSPRKKGAQYPPEFKERVVKFASKTNYKKAARKFGVHHATVSVWCKEKEREKLATSATKDPEGNGKSAEEKFLVWIRACNEASVNIKHTDVREKVKEIIDSVGENEVERTCKWFYLWYKTKILREGCIEYGLADLIYPPSWKIEVLKVAQRQSCNSAANCFFICRKQVVEWMKNIDRLQKLAENGHTKTGSGRNALSADADREIWEWYESCKARGCTPKSREIRIKAVEIFRKHGHYGAKGSAGWYKRWRKRFGVPVQSQLETEGDNHKVASEGV